jgi:hypothetical protein
MVLDLLIKLGFFVPKDSISVEVKVGSSMMTTVCGEMRPDLPVFWQPIGNETAQLACSQNSTVPVAV